MDDLHSDSLNINKQSAPDEKRQPDQGRGDHGRGLRDRRPWNSSHGSGGCSQDELKASGGAGITYCFMPN
ncbi:MAG: hypothetical protein ABR570_13985 [Burkholderiales bacterium]